LYLAAFLDRTNVGNAKIEGLQQALNMTNAQYNATLTIFFVSYSVFEPLTNVLLKRTRPSIFIPIIIIIWVSVISRTTDPSPSLYSCLRASA
jgi:tellurite resistance protein TehA-like permease